MSIKLSIALSLVLCTRNRAESLKKTLDSISAQAHCESLAYEVIVVDNNSSDNTSIIIGDFAKVSRFPVRYVFESKTGLSFARNRGILESHGDIIVFTDDDVIPDENWLYNIYRCFQKYNTDAVCGKIKALYDAGIPEWVKKDKILSTGLIINYDYGELPVKFDKNSMRYFIGANMAFKRTVFEKAGYFRTDLGVGTDIMGEDTEFAMRILKKGIFDIYYAGDAVVSHGVELKRLSMMYIAHWFLMSGRFNARIGIYAKDRFSVFGIPSYVYVNMLKGILMMAVTFYDQRRFIYGMEPFFKGVGYIMERIRPA